MHNPFSYSGVVTGAAFCNREAEMADLMRRILYGQNTLLFARRRTGKTSLIHHLVTSPLFARQAAKLKKDQGLGLKAVIVDLFGTLSERDFITAMFNGLTAFERNLDRLAGMLKGLRLTVSVDPVSGLPAVAPGIAPHEAPAYLEHVMAIYAALSKKNRLLVALDEFQEVGRYAEEGFEKRLRREVQKHDSISYLFAGSRRHLLELMFNSPDRAFYRMARSFPLEPIAAEHYRCWAGALFEQKGTVLPEAVIDTIIERCDHNPAYIQQFLSELWHADTPDADTVNAVEDALLRENQAMFMKDWDALTLNQQKTLKLIMLTAGKNLYAASSLQAVGFNSPGILNRTLTSLVEKEIVCKNGAYIIQDPMFKRWLARLFSAYPAGP